MRETSGPLQRRIRNVILTNTRTRILKITALFLIFAVAGGISAHVALTILVRSEETVVVPEVTGQKVLEVLKTLSAMGLNTQLTASEFSDAVPLNHVVYQEPAAGTAVKKGRDVRIVISKGRQSVRMPDLRGLSLDQGRVLLEENGFCTGTTSFSYSPELPKDKILAHTPQPGTLLQKDECVALLVSRGNRPETYKMPDLKGLPIEEAILSIEKLRLKPGDVQRVFQNDLTPETVVNQEPTAGYFVSEGTLVDLVVNTRADNRTLFSRELRRGIGLLKYKTDNGFIKSRIRVKLQWRGITSDIFDEFVRPGRDIWICIPRDEDVRVYLYKDDLLVETRDFSLSDGY